MSLTPFMPQGATVTFTAATSPPTAQLATANSSSSSGNIVTQTGPISASNYRVINSGSYLVFLGWGSSAAAAATAAGAVGTSIPLLPGTDEILAFPANYYFTGTCSGSNTSVVYVTPGNGV